MKRNLSLFLFFLIICCSKNDTDDATLNLSDTDLELVTLSGKVLINITFGKKRFLIWMIPRQKIPMSMHSLFRVIQIQKVFLNHYYFMKIDLVGLLMIT